MFDFTHLDDTVAGVLRLIDAIENGATGLPTVRLCTGGATTPGELARTANRAGGERSRIVEMPHRCHDVTRFVGDPQPGPPHLASSRQAALGDVSKARSTTET